LAVCHGVLDQEFLPDYRCWSWRCCSKSPHGALNATSRQREQPKRIIMTWLIGLVSLTLAAQLT
jgi:hypothetical protein